MQTGLAGRIAQPFMHSKLTPLLMAAFLGIGIYSALLTPREEDPQISVPIADIFVGYPGASPAEVEHRIAQPLERTLANIAGVEYVYSASMKGQAMLTVQFYVGEETELSMVRLYQELLKRMDTMPPGATMPLIKTRSVDDVPVLALTLWSAGNTYDDYSLRRIGTELAQEIKKIEDVAAVDVIGGRSRQIRIELDPARLMAYRVDPLSIAQALQAANSQQASGRFTQNDTEYLVDAGSFLETADDVKRLVIGTHQGQPMYLASVAHVVDGPAEPSQYVAFGYGPAATTEAAVPGAHSAVTLAIAKRPGTDAMRLSETILQKVDLLDATLLPNEVKVEVTRNYGATASQKVSSLLFHLVVAVLSVGLIVGLSMGWRGGLVVFLSVPVSFALTLFVYYLYGYTLNRITLFALIFVTGIVVDDSIIIAENMERHFKMRKLPFRQAALAAISEVGNPTILATFTVIAAVLPMAFVSGLMGPYMSPMPIGASMAMLFSLIVALIITPWLAYMLLTRVKHDEEKEYRLEDTRIYKLYVATMRPLLDRAALRWGFLLGTGVLLIASMFLVINKVVAVKMLPYDDKSEVQVVIDMPEGTTLERTAAVTRELAAWLATQTEVVNYQTYVGTASPANLQGLLRQYDLRRGSHVADIQVNLRPADVRDRQSHAIAKDLRPGLQAIAETYGANVKIAEVPPGPPVRATLVAEVYGPDAYQQEAIAAQIRDVFAETPGVVDVDWDVEADQTEYTFVIDQEKAMLAGIPAARITQALALALNGQDVSTLRSESEIEAVGLHVRLAETNRSSLAALQSLPVQAMDGTMVPVGTLADIVPQTRDKTIFRKNQRRVVYVTGDVAGSFESPVYAMLDMEEALENITVPAGYTFTQHYTSQPFIEDDYSMKWDGEWHITYQVFRDLGIAFAAVLLIIYLLIVAWFQDLKVPYLLMVAIPLSLIGILVGHWLLGAFFTATSMIGMIALAGIMVRNSVLLIDFVKLRLADGVAVRQAVIEAGAVRTRPILLTAGTVVIGATVILFDPIFQGLAISLMGGSIASTALTLVIVPLLYAMFNGGTGQAASPATPVESSEAPAYATTSA